jgi:hypothetical protein
MLWRKDTTSPATSRNRIWISQSSARSLVTVPAEPIRFLQIKLHHLNSVFVKFSFSTEVGLILITFWKDP